MKEHKNSVRIDKKEIARKPDLRNKYLRDQMLFNSPEGIENERPKIKNTEKYLFKKNNKVKKGVPPTQEEIREIVEKINRLEDDRESLKEVVEKINKALKAKELEDSKKPQE